MNILVTGGAGFIGSNLCESLLAQNHNVVSMDNFNDYYNPQIKQANIAEINRQFREFVSLKGDIRNYGDVEQVFSKYKPQVVVHLAACAGVRPSIENPMLYTEVNVNGTINILECAKNHSVKHIAFASSSSVYGNNEKVPFSEEDRVDNPISPYAATKKAGELLCHTYSKLYNINIACLRFFTVYGKRQRPDLAIHKFTKLISEEKQVPFYGNGETMRDYTYIDDILDGINKTISWLLGDNGYDIFNLGESNTISLNKMIATIENTLGKKAILNKLPMQAGDVEKTYADITKSKAVLGYNPKTDFEQGIFKFVEWYRAL